MPQVAYQIEGQTAVDWCDLYQRLAVEGIYFMRARTNTEVISCAIINIILGLFQRIKALLLNGSGGDIFSGSSLGDCMRQEAGTYGCRGCVIAVAADQRYGMAHSRLILHSAEALSSGTIYLMHRLVSHLADLSQHSKRLVQSWFKPWVNAIAVTFLPIWLTIWGCFPCSDRWNRWFSNFHVWTGDLDGHGSHSGRSESGSRHPSRRLTCWPMDT